MFDKQIHVSNNSLSSWKMQSSQVNDHGVVSIQEKVSSREGEQTLAWAIHVQTGSGVWRGKETGGLGTGKVGKCMWRKLKHLAEEENNSMKKQDGRRDNQSGQISHTYLAQPTAISQKKLPVWKEKWQCKQVRKWGGYCTDRWLCPLKTGKTGLPW